MKSKAGPVALGGMLTAAAVVVMALGSLIPVNTYVCPVVCILMTRPVMELCGRRIALCYYIAVAVLSLLMAPDREAAVVYVCLGYYPLLRRYFEKIGLKWLKTAAKLAFFTAAGALSYWLLLAVLGIPVLEEAGGIVFLAVLIVMWDLLFLLTDRLLGMPMKRRK